IPVATVAVAPPTASIVVGATVQLTATPQDAAGNPLTGRTVTWQTSDGTIATVDATGLVTGKALGGPVTITATSEGKAGTAAITVTPIPVATVAVAPPTASIVVGATVQLSATPQDAVGNPLTGRTITWQSGNAAVASVDANGLVTGKALGGPVTIPATSEGKAGTAAVPITPIAAALAAVARPAAILGVNATRHVLA